MTISLDCKYDTILNNIYIFDLLKGEGNSSQKESPTKHVNPRVWATE